MRALFETLPVLPGQDLLLRYRARTPDELIFRYELEEVARRRGARLFYLVGSGAGGLSAPELLNVVPDLAERDVYMCASPRMSDAVRASLHEAGLPGGVPARGAVRLSERRGHRPGVRLRSA
jgi:ferredoxin-NADP reductase